MAIRRTQPLLLLTTFAVAPFAFAAACMPDQNAQPQVGQTPYAPPSAAPMPSGYPPAPGTAPPGYPAPTPPPGYAQQPQPAAPAPGAQGPLAPIMTTDPAQLQAIFAQAATAAQAILQPPGTPPPAHSGGAAPAPGASPIPGGMPTDLTGAGIAAVALVQAKGMQPEGNQAKGQLAEGGHLEFMVPMQAGKCYTLIGFSPPGQIRNLDLNLLAPPFYNIMAGQDTTDDNIPVIGKAGNPMCPVVPVPLNYKVDIVARTGSGQVAVQLFSRPK
jgi:hypothetical protein